MDINLKEAKYPKYEEAAIMLGKEGSAGEADAIINYCNALSIITDDTVRKNILERIGDELNHLLGDTLDAINLAGFTISSDGLDEILEGLRKAGENSKNEEQNTQQESEVKL